MKNFLLAGDSWGIGVFAGAGDTYSPTGEGIQSILERFGHSVTNISKAGGSNTLIVDRLNHRWDNYAACLFGVDPADYTPFDLTNIDYVIFLQTDIFRERHYYGKQFENDADTRWKVLEEQFIKHLLTFNSLDHIYTDYFTKLYSSLNKLNKTILCVGGWSMLHPSISNYTNLIPAIPSATKLLINELEQDVYISDPEWYLQLSKHNAFMEKFGAEFKPLSIVAAHKLDLIYKNWQEVHPPLDGYQAIVDELTKFW